MAARCSGVYRFGVRIRCQLPRRPRDTFAQAGKRRVFITMRLHTTVTLGVTVLSKVRHLLSRVAGSRDSWIQDSIPTP